MEGVSCPHRAHMMSKLSSEIKGPGSKKGMEIKGSGNKRAWN